MASLDSLPADQRAVLELVLQRGRSYDEIAHMLSIDRAGVRQRALSAFDALGPQTRLEPLRRALITDYLLGQLPGRISEETRASLARTPAERAWARVLASELAPLARGPLPEIPAPEPAGGAPASPAPAAAAASGRSASGALSRDPASPDGPRDPGETGDGAPAAPRRGGPARRPSSRLGGAVLLALGAAVVVAVVLVLVLTGGSKKHTSTVATHPASTTTPATTTSTPAKALGQVNLKPPSPGSQAKGVAQIVKVNNTSLVVVIVAVHVPPNSHNAYAVWLYNSPTSSRLVGFVSPGVGSNGQLQTEGPLAVSPANYKQLLITLETQAHPKAPGQIVLQGPIPAANY